MNRRKCRALTVLTTALALASLAVAAVAQTAPPKTPPAAPGAAPSATPQAAPATSSSELDQLAWLRGCWAGKVAQFEYVESWLEERGGMMVGINQTLVHERKQAGAKTRDYQYLRLEQRADGVYYVAIPSGKKETAFKLTSVGEEMGRKAYTFTNPRDEFPKQIVYLRGKEGALFAKVAGEVDNHPKEATYPMQHVDCLTGVPLAH